MLSYSIRKGDAGIAQLVECQLPKLNVAGSNPVARSEELLGKQSEENEGGDEVGTCPLFYFV